MKLELEHALFHSLLPTVLVNYLKWILEAEKY